MDGQPEVTQETAVEPIVISVPSIEGENISFGSGFVVGAEAKQDLKMEQAGACFLEAGRDADVQYGGAMIMAADRDLHVNYGGGMVMAAGGSATVNNGGSQWLVSKQVTAKNSVFGVVLANQMQLEEGSRVLLDTKQAIAFGAAAGLILAAASWLFNLGRGSKRKASGSSSCCR